MSKYFYTKAWFLASELRNLIYTYVDGTKPLSMLEIGCFEGLSTSFFSDEFLKHPDSQLYAVDPFDLGDTTTPLTSDTERLFLKNIHQSDHFHKILFFKQTSDDFFKMNEATFDFVYIDGSHIPEQIWKDMMNSYKFTKKGGIIWMDDYEGNSDITKTVDGFLEMKGHNVEILHKGYQIGFRKLVDS
jgi:predicted O-methyltransferase YrrM